MTCIDPRILTCPGLDPEVHVFVSIARARRREWPDQVRPRRKGQAGFTLIEVLVALAIIGLALGSVTGVFGLGLAGHETASTAETALAVAEEQLTLAAATPRPGAANGVFANRFAWQATIAPYQDAADKNGGASPNLPPLYRIAVSVAWHDGRHTREVSLSTLRLGTPSP